MGSVIIVPAPFSVNEPIAMNYSSVFATSNDIFTCPVNFMSGDPNSSNSGLYGTVNIPKQQFVNSYHDPLTTYNEYFKLGFKNDYRRNFNRTKKTSNDLVHSVQYLDIAKMFWDHEELESIVSTWVGNLLLQIGNHNWNFASTREEDYQQLRELTVRRKSHSFESSSLLREEIMAWLKEHATDYDLFESNILSQTNFDEIYIRDDTEAVHFKMRWFGAEPEGDEI